MTLNLHICSGCPASATAETGLDTGWHVQGMPQEHAAPCLALACRQHNGEDEPACWKTPLDPSGTDVMSNCSSQLQCRRILRHLRGALYELKCWHKALSTDAGSNCRSPLQLSLIMHTCLLSCMNINTVTTGTQTIISCLAISMVSSAASPGTTAWVTECLKHCRAPVNNTRAAAATQSGTTSPCASAQGSA